MINCIEQNKKLMNTLYIFTDELKNIKGIHMDFGFLQKTMIMGKEFDKIYNHYDDGDEYMRLEVGASIYQLAPDVIDYIEVKSTETQIKDFVKSI